MIPRYQGLSKKSYQPLSSNQKYPNPTLWGRKEEGRDVKQEMGGHDNEKIIDNKKIVDNKKILSKHLLLKWKKKYPTFLTSRKHVMSFLCSKADTK